MLSLGFLLLCVYAVYRRRYYKKKGAAAGPILAHERPVHPSISLGIHRTPKADMLDEFGDSMLSEERGDVMRVARGNTDDDIRKLKKFKEALPHQLVML